MEARALRHCWARSVGLSCRIPFSPKAVNYTYDLRVIVQLPVVDMKLSGPHHPLTAAGRFTETAARSPALAIPALTQTTLTANGPSLLLREDPSPSASTLSALTIPENASRTISCSTTARMLTLHRLDRIAAQTLR